MPAVAADQGADDIVLASPQRILRLHYDPWSDGVWIGTEGGLFFKDLETGGLRHFSIAAGLPNAIVYDVAAAAGRVWIATGQGTVVLDKATNTVSPVIDTRGGQFFHKTFTVFPEGDVVWLGTASAGLFKVDAATLRASSVPNPETGKKFDYSINGLGSYGEDLYISATNYGLVHWDRASGESDLYDYAYRNPDNPRYNRISVSRAAVWIGTELDGVIRVDRATGDLDEYSNPKTVNALTVYAPLTLGTKTWFPTPNNVVSFEETTGQWKRWTEIPAGDVGGGANDLVYAKGQLYAATRWGQVVRYDSAQDAWLPAAWWTSAQVMGYNLVQSCHAEPDGTLIFGTGGGGAYLLDAAAPSLTGVGMEPGSKGRPADINILDTATDATSRFFGTYNGVSEMTFSTGTYRHFYVDGRQAGDAEWGHNAVRDIELDGDQVWFATQSTQETRFMDHGTEPWHPGKVTRLDRATNALTIYGEEAGLANGNVTTLAVDGGKLWIGMRTGGIDILDKASGSITHRYPASGSLSVNDILVTPQAVWVATLQEGLLRFTRDGVMTKVADTAGVLPLTLEMIDGTLWVGTYWQGLVAVDPATLTATPYLLGLPFDRIVHCMVVKGDILYLGTSWGVERFQLVTKTFLPQVLGPTVSGPSRPTGSILISDPAAGTNLDSGMVTVQGTAVAPEGATVSLRVSDGPWTAAAGTSAWSGTLPVGGAYGNTLVTARLSHAGRTLAEAFLEITVGGEAATGEAVAQTIAGIELSHSPVLEAYAGEPVAIDVTARPSAEGLTATLQVRAPGEDAFTGIPMVPTATGLTATIPPFSATGTAAYRILVDSASASQRLPAPFSGFGDAYTVHVVAPAGEATPVVSGERVYRLNATDDQTIEVHVQNTGSLDGYFVVALSGKLASKAEAEPAIEVPAGESRTLAIVLDLTGVVGKNTLTVGVQSAYTEGARTATKLLIYTPGGGDAELFGSQGAPVPPWVVVMALAMAVLARKRLG